MAAQIQSTCFRPRLLFFENKFQENLEMVIDGEGKISKIAYVCDSPSDPHSSAPLVLLPAMAIFPGLCNGHSHAFQRGLRGGTQNRGSESQDNFWTWREAMYRLANRLSPDDIYSLSAFAFSEMLSTGITTVGEFHYLHHQSDGRPYEDANELGKQVLRAAQDVGIRIVLLDVAYGRGGWRKEIQKNQKRFWDKNAQTYLKRVSDLKNHLGPNQSLGLAPHSIRAVDQNWLKDIAQAQQKDFQDFPIHMHLQEQPSEIEECREEYPKKTPLQVVSEGGLLNDSFTAVHATHTTPQDRLLLAESGARVCACPTTERDLGDGFLDAKGMVEKKVEICLGTDSQVFINLWEDARELEYHARLQTLSRNVLAQNSAVFLQPCMTRNGARALRVNAGVLEPGRWADFITLDLSHPTLVGSTRDTLLTQMIFSMSPDAVCEAYVAGRKVLIDGRHAQHEKFSQAFQKVFEDVN